MKILNIFFLSVLLVSAAVAQKPADPVAEYRAAAAKCRELFQKESSDAAGKSCKDALNLAEKLPEANLAEKLSAHQNYGLYLYFKEEYGEAEISFMVALDFGRKMPVGSREVAEVYFNLGRTNYALGFPEIADEYYNSAGAIYRATLMRTKSRAKKKECLEQMQFLLLLRKGIATQNYDAARIKEIERQIKLLPRL